jgi:hypothetical protein
MEFSHTWMSVAVLVTLIGVILFAWNEQKYYE